MVKDYYTADGRFKNESILNKYYNMGGYNDPKKIGYLISTMNTVNPHSVEEWKDWYLKHVYDEDYLIQFVIHMYFSIPGEYNIGPDEVKDYIYDVMFRRTFNGSRFERETLSLLQSEIDPNLRHASKEWDTNYGIDFYVNDVKSKPIGIQLKPISFYNGNMGEITSVKKKIQNFCNNYDTRAMIIYYNYDSTTNQMTLVGKESVVRKLRHVIVTGLFEDEKIA